MSSLLAVRSWVHSLTLVVIAALIAGVGIVVPNVVSPVSSAQAASWPEYTIDMSKWNPGKIISDDLFFDKSSMSVSQIQTFLNEKVPACRSGYTCLKDFAQATTSKPADMFCTGAYAAGARETAALIIWKVAQACGVSPKVILVTLEKEQGLVADDWPGDRQYRYAMGADCPDTGDCGATSGFFHQVHRGVWQFKRYMYGRINSEYYTDFASMKPVGATSNIQYSPTASCGTKSVYIANQATHILYVYTPYTPNEGALAAGWGTASCGAYGNRNFFRYYFKWFGDPNGIPPFPWTYPLQSGATAGQEKVGTVLRVTAGSFRGTPSPTVGYQWFACTTAVAAAAAVPSGCTSISGATASSFTLTAAQANKFVTVRLTATSSSGSTARVAPSTAKVYQVPTNTVAPAITGTLLPTQQLTVSNGTWTGIPSPTYSYQWKVCANPTVATTCVNITGATASTLVARTADVGKYYLASVTAKNVASTSVVARATAQLQSAPIATAVPTVSGITKVSGVITSTPGTWSAVPAATYSYEFFACTQRILLPSTVTPINCTSAGAPSATPTLVATSSHVGKYILAKVTATNAVGSASRYSASTLAVTAGDVPMAWTYPVQSGSTAGNQFVGNELRVTAGSFKAIPAATYSYQWLACATRVTSVLATTPSNCVPITGATASTFRLTSAELGKFVTVKFIGTNTAGTAFRIAVSSLAIVANPAVPVVSGTSSVASVLTTTTSQFTPTRVLATLTLTGPTYQGYPIYGVQDALRASGYGTPRTGVYDLRTIADVKKFQIANAVPTPDGYVGSVTWTKMRAVTVAQTPTYTYRWLRCSAAVTTAPTAVPSAAPASCAVVAGAIASTYTLSAPDRGKYVMSEITAGNVQESVKTRWSITAGIVA